MRLLRSFPPQFWLVIVLELFERGSYYGVMSVLSVYLTEVLHFAREDVGLATMATLAHHSRLVGAVGRVGEGAAA